VDYLSTETSPDEANLQILVVTLPVPLASLKKVIQKKFQILFRVRNIFYEIVDHRWNTLNERFVHQFQCPYAGSLGSP
jgi:hypothetical protein